MNMKDPHGSWICKYCKSAQNRRLFKLWERLFHFKTFIVSYSHLFRGESLKAGNNNICVQCPVNICSPHRFIFVCKGCKSLYTVAAYEQFWRETTWKKNRKFFFRKHLLDLFYDCISNICCGQSVDSKNSISFPNKTSFEGCFDWKNTYQFGKFASRALADVDGLVAGVLLAQPSIASPATSLPLFLLPLLKFFQTLSATHSLSLPHAWLLASCHVVLCLWDIFGNRFSPVKNPWNL